MASVERVVDRRVLLAALAVATVAARGDSVAVVAVVAAAVWVAAG